MGHKERGSKEQKRVGVKGTSRRVDKGVWTRRDRGIPGVTGGGSTGTEWTPEIVPDVQDPIVKPVSSTEVPEESL